MEEIVRKGMRFEKPRTINIQLRPELYWFLRDCCLSVEPDPHISVFIRGVLEDFYDKHRSDPEVTRDE